MKIMIIVLKMLVLVLVWLKYAKSDLVNAISDLEPLLETHKRIVEDIEDYVKYQMEQLAILNKSITQYKNEHSLMRNIPNHWVNPITSFTLIKRLTVDMEYLNGLIDGDENKLQDEKDILPTKEDLEGATDSLLRLQQAYQLNTTQLANGIITGTFSFEKQLFTEHTNPLTAHDCFTIALRTGNISRALEWMLVAHDKYTQKETVDNSFEGQLVNCIRKAYHALKDFANAIEWTVKLMQLQPENENQLANDLAAYNEGLTKNLKKRISNPRLNANELFTQKVEALCRGEISLTEELKKDLKCYYKSGFDAFLKLAPIKAEQLLLDPLVIMYHHVISDNEIGVIMNMVKSVEFNSSRVTNDETGTAYKSKIRLSKQAFIKNTDITEKISRRIEDFTDLSLKTAEDYQVVNYGLGGYYNRHSDYFNTASLKRYSQGKGNRIATVLLYLSEVEQGGATIFPDGPDITIYPKKHAAIFWYNSIPSGEKDNLAIHAACPVLRGSKWVATKWIREVGQEFRQPCALNRFERQRL